MRWMTLTLVCLGVLGAGTPSTADAAEGFKVVVNAVNPTDSLSTSGLSRLFLKQKTSWEHGAQAAPVDLRAGSPVRTSFSVEVYGRDVNAIKNYWQRMIFSGRAVPPPEKGSDLEVLAFVRSNPGAVGYVAVDTELGEGVKVLKVTK